MHVFCACVMFMLKKECCKGGWSFFGRVERSYIDVEDVWIGRGADRKSNSVDGGGVMMGGWRRCNDGWMKEVQ